MKKLGLVTLLTTLCLSQTTQASVLEVDAFNIKNSEFMPVFVGGWGSCDSLRSKEEKEKFGKHTPHNMFLYKQAKRYVETVNKHSQSGINSFMLVCATKGSLDGKYSSGDLYSLTYEVEGTNVKVPRKKATLVNLDSFQSNVYFKTFPKRDKREHLTTKILKEAKGRPVVIFGHSYGGLISKRIIEIIADPEVYRDSESSRDQVLYRDTVNFLKNYTTFPIHTFFSLEGISAVKCRILRSIQSGLQSMLGFNTYEGCKEPLESFQEEKELDEREKIISPKLNQTAHQITDWYNFMLLDSDLPTRAAKASENGIQNIILDVSPYGDTEEEHEKSQKDPFKNAHHMLGFHTKTWQKVCELTFKSKTEICNPIENIDNKGK